MIRLITPLIILIFLGLASCQKSAYVHQFDKNELQISISSRGGWCAGADSLTIGAEKTVYVHRKTCKDDFKTENLDTNSPEWNALVSLLDTDKFNAVDINECGVCYDGTDLRITVKQGNFRHSILFDKIDDPRLTIIKPFIEKLISVRNQYKAEFEK